MPLSHPGRFRPSTLFMSAAHTASSAPSETLDHLRDKRKGLHESILDPPERPSRPRHSRKQPEGHIPRPPNAFILFRSSFVRSQRVSPDVETNPTTISKIIGLTWKSLPADERRVWYARARQAVEEHRSRFPEYAFHPSQRRPRGGKAEKQMEARRKVRQRVVENPERCVKIAELLGEGKHGEALDGAMQEFDRDRESLRIVTRFEPPITATTYRRASSAPADTEHPATFSSSTPVVVQRRRSSSSGPSSRSRETSATIDDLPISLNSALAPSSAVDTPIDPEYFCFSAFSFDSALPVASTDSTCDPLWLSGPHESPTWNNSSHSSMDDLRRAANHGRQYPPELDLDTLITEEYAHDLHPLSASSSDSTFAPTAWYSYDYGTNSPSYVPDIDSQIEPRLTQVESDFMNLMAQYSLQA
ncbi:hypothetical protein B0H12DRAFT_1158928 [Mycena haematopus]|nr:hypothetical protein B0H12DRAFT_1158928 [Mycena haematopus]